MADICSIARSLDEAAMQARAIPQITGSDASMTLDQAYEIQREAIGLRLTRGERIRSKSSSTRWKAA